MFLFGGVGSWKVKGKDAELKEVWRCSSKMGDLGIL
jgi:hypothetical protein